MCKLTGDYNTTLPSNQTREPVHFAEMLCLVCLAACTQSYVSCHAKAKVIIFIQFPTKVLC